ncbi:MAG: hypothetical protein M3350_05145 [Actinomycetota bacterium]|nr:hypothetical protein [Actinomycetota bacterium]
MARVLIVGCGCRGRRLARDLIADGRSVRGTTRDPAALGVIQAAGAEAEVADPDHLGTLLALLQGVSAVCWLMGSASGPAHAVAALHGPRLRSLQQKLVDSPARGLVYEAAGTVEPELLTAGVATVRELGETFRMPVGVVEEDPAELDAWSAAMRAAVTAVLA